MNSSKAIEQLNSIPELDGIYGKASDNPQNAFEILYSLKTQIPKEAYAYTLRKLWKEAGGMSRDFSLALFDGVSREDLMYEEELEALKHMDDIITIYRGAYPNEKIPKLSWTLRKSEATNNSNFANGRLFVARIRKEDIIMYLCADVDEQEIVINVESGFEVYNT